MEQQCARILLGFRWASSIIVRRREAWIEGMRPRTFGNERVTSRPRPDWLLLAAVGIGSSKWKGKGWVLTMAFDILDGIGSDVGGQWRAVRAFRAIGVRDFLLCTRERIECLRDSTGQDVYEDGEAYIPENAFDCMRPVFGASTPPMHFCPGSSSRDSTSNMTWLFCHHVPSRAEFHEYPACVGKPRPAEVDHALGGQQQAGSCREIRR